MAFSSMALTIVSILQSRLFLCRTVRQIADQRD
jgi:hypothetical protein